MQPDEDRGTNRYFQEFNIPISKAGRKNMDVLNSENFLLVSLTGIPGIPSADIFESFRVLRQYLRNIRE